VTRTILLAPGASGDARRVAPFLAGLERRGLDGHAVELPRGRAERAVPVYATAMARYGTADDGTPPVIGGQSFGGRVASLLAADPPAHAASPAGLVLLSYPLHAPGRHAAWDERTTHWPAIECPVLLLSGESDPFARIDLLREAVPRLKRAELVTYPRMGHGLDAALEDVVDRIARFVTEL
jgi:predicted alpha/beta-hydrolase family hydrolase